MNKNFINLYQSTNENSQKFQDILSYLNTINEILPIITRKFDIFLKITFAAAYNISTIEDDNLTIQNFTDNYASIHENLIQHLDKMSIVLYKSDDIKLKELSDRIINSSYCLKELEEQSFLESSLDLIKNWLKEVDQINEGYLMIVFDLIILINNYLENLNKILIGLDPDFMFFKILKEKNPIIDCLYNSTQEKLNSLSKNLEKLIRGFNSPTLFLYQAMKIDSNTIKMHFFNKTDELFLFKLVNKKIIDDYLQLENQYYTLCKEIQTNYWDIKDFKHNADNKKEEYANENQLKIQLLQEKIRFINDYYVKLLDNIIVSINNHNKNFFCKWKNFLEELMNDVWISEGLTIFKEIFVYCMDDISIDNVKELLNFLDLLIRYTQSLDMYINNGKKPEENFTKPSYLIPEENYIFYFYEKSKKLFEDSLSTLENINFNLYSVKISLKERTQSILPEIDNTLSEEESQFYINQNDFCFISRMPKYINSLFFIFGSKEEIEKVVDMIVSNKIIFEENEAQKSLQTNALIKNIKVLFNRLTMEKKNLLNYVKKNSSTDVNNLFYQDEELLEKIKRLEINKKNNKEYFDDLDKFFMKEGLKSTSNLTIEGLEILLKFSLNICKDFKDSHEQLNKKDFIQIQKIDDTINTNENRENNFSEKQSYLENTQNIEENFNEKEIDNKQNFEFEASIFEKKTKNSDYETAVNETLNELDTKKIQFLKMLILEDDKNSKVKLLEEFIQIDKQHSKLNNEKKQIEIDEIKSEIVSKNKRMEKVEKEIQALKTSHKNLEIKLDDKVNELKLLTKSFSTVFGYLNVRRLLEFIKILHLNEKKKDENPNISSSLYLHDIFKFDLCEFNKSEKESNNQLLLDIACDIKKKNSITLSENDKINHLNLPIMIKKLYSNCSEKIHLNQFEVNDYGVMFSSSLYKNLLFVPKKLLKNKIYLCILLSLKEYINKRFYTTKGKKNDKYETFEIKAI